MSPRAATKVQIEGEPEAAARAREVLLGLYNRLDEGHDIDAELVNAIIAMSGQPTLDGIVAPEVIEPPKVMIRTRKKTIVPRSKAAGRLYGGAEPRRHDLRARAGGHGQDLCRGGAGGAAIDQRLGRPADPVAAGGGGGRAARLPARRHEGEGRSLSPPALRRALRHAADRAGRAADRVRRDRDRADRLHARADALATPSSSSTRRRTPRRSR